MSRLDTVFRLSVHLLAALAGVMLAVAEARPSPEALTPVLVIVAYVLVERQGRYVLSMRAANVLGFLAVSVALGELLLGGIEARLLSGAHLLVYLSWVVLFQRKTPRHYWWMCALAVLQVAVGSVLIRHGAYGALLVAFLFLAVWTLSTFSLYQAALDVAFAGTPTAVGTDSSPRLPRPSGEASRRAAGDAPAKAEPFSFLAASDVRGAMYLDGRGSWIRLRFAGGTFLTGCASLVIGLVFFLMIPRLWAGRVAPEDDDDTSLIGMRWSGFSERVELGDFGRILVSAEPVLRVRLFDNDTGQALSVPAWAARHGMDEPLFRGGVLDRYVEFRGRWEAPSSPGPRLRLPASPTGPGNVRQEVAVEPLGTNVLFAMRPVVACRVDGYPSPAWLEPVSGVLARGGRHEKELTVVAFSPRVANASRPAVPPVLFPGQFDQRPRDLRDLSRLARRLAGYNGETDHPPEREMAARLLAHLGDSARFQYTLDTTRVNRSVDPIEDFLFFRRQGHCEYFASALALMLREVGIPARLVNGFKGGELQTDGSFEVQHRHAHAWVEAWIDGGWTVMDPTPAAERSETIERMAPGIHSLADLVDVVSQSWTRYVVNMNFARQQQTFYRPLKDAMSDVWEAARGDREKASSLLASGRRFLSSPERWISWQGGLVSFALLTLGAALVWAVRRTSRLIRRVWTRMRKRVERRGLYVEFYDRFQRLCRRQGLTRGDSDTQREFALFARRQLAPQLAAAGLSDLPQRLVEVFYSVRFGERPLDRSMEEALRQDLDRLELALAPARPASRAASAAG
ncbi:MAG: DUF3488 and transglutaminase-like domain-containing protein [Planctomycetes bacterium]|nr:DUF3488 and transglutaminase-like domain-containing protein [Planctomycetota bacterium]